MSTLASAYTPSTTGHPVRQVLARRPELFTLMLLVALCAFVAAANPDFLRLATLFDLARASVVIGLFALGVFVILAAGGIDVSFTAIAALCMYGVTKGVVEFAPGLPLPVVFTLSIAIGLGLGLVNGFLVHHLRVPSLIVTIGTQYTFRGLLLTFIGTIWITTLPPQMDDFGKVALLTTTSSQGATIILPLFVLILPAVAVLTWWILRRTLLGRAIFAVGGSPAVAERLGYDLRSIHLFIFGYAGALAGLAGIIHACSNRQANPFDLVGSEIDVIAAVVLGGARITGGTGTVVGVVLGTLLVVVINNVLIMAGVPSTWQRVVVGAFILIAGAFMVNRRRA
ncbi:ABC transporter permease [Salinarimonas soli]|uniref:ABC transporter permease n=1 Tax=Salinarimonas soli TaxID=1638099 RepID=A0A5B2V825_9HYPH|nr:ABC transporter permease [Salinarimonas soli]KAA2235633.1 ABC transporter permease [Salinarimonas soli]